MHAWCLSRLCNFSFVSIIGLFVTVRLGFMVIYACLLSWFMIFCVYRVMFDIFLCLRTVLVSLWFMHCMYTPTFVSHQISIVLCLFCVGRFWYSTV